jgi:uncharacterized protein YggE
MPLKPIFAALALFLAALPAAAAEPPTPSLSVSGEGREMVVPDIVIVTLGVISEAPTARGALNANNADMQKVIASIVAAGVKETDIGTIDFSIAPVYPPNPDDNSNAPPRIVGYRVSNELRVTIRELTKSGDILDRVVSAGANRVNSISFDVGDQAAPAEKALRAAIADAKRKAEIMADAGGVRLVRVLSITTDGTPPLRFEALAMAAKSVPVMAGERALSANATMVFEIAPK